MASKQKTESQTARFIEAAKKTGADESGKAFEKAFKKIAASKQGSRTKKQTP